MAIQLRRLAAAWEQFVEIYTPLIYGYCRSRGLQDGDAADVAQESMRAVARAIGKFEYDPQRGKFRKTLGIAHPVSQWRIMALFLSQSRFIW